MSLFIIREAKRKLDLYIRSANSEIQGFFKVVSHGVSSMMVTDIRLARCSNTSSHTEVDHKSLNEFLTNLLMDGENPQDWKGWWHSHNEMSAFFSAEDEENIVRFGNGLGKENSWGWIVSIVGNKKGEYESRIDTFSPVWMHLEPTLTVYENIYDDQELVNGIKEELKEKVTIQAPVVVRSLGGVVYNSNDRWDVREKRTNKTQKGSRPRKAAEDLPGFQILDDFYQEEPDEDSIEYQSFLHWWNQTGQGKLREDEKSEALKTWERQVGLLGD